MSGLFITTNNFSFNLASTNLVAALGYAIYFSSHIFHHLRNETMKTSCNLELGSYSSVTISVTIFTVSKPAGVSHLDCAACLRGGVRAYTALHFQAHLEPGTIALVFSAASVSAPKLS